LTALGVSSLDEVTVMSRYFQVVGFLALAVAFTIGVFTFAVAEPPASRAEEKIRLALEGKLPVQETGGGILGDVIGVIQERRSVLEGSSLDPSVGNTKATPIAARSKRAHAAEQLLRASRLLEELDATDQERTDLVHRMRAEAVKVLLE